MEKDSRNVRRHERRGRGGAAAAVAPGKTARRADGSGGNEGLMSVEHAADRAHYRTRGTAVGPRGGDERRDDAMRSHVNYSTGKQRRWELAERALQLREAHEVTARDGDGNAGDHGDSSTSDDNALLRDPAHVHVLVDDEEPVTAYRRCYTGMHTRTLPEPYASAEARVATTAAAAADADDDAEPARIVMTRKGRRVVQPQQARRRGTSVNSAAAGPSGIAIAVERARRGGAGAAAADGRSGLGRGGAGRHHARSLHAFKQQQRGKQRAVRRGELARGIAEPALQRSARVQSYW